jgi:NAD(P)-dependent dehydrogenase (short-subunit alcohol dehydrogenase family)
MKRLDDHRHRQPGRADPSWAKRAVASLVHDLAVVLAPQGIRANAVHGLSRLRSDAKEKTT